MTASDPTLEFYASSKNTRAAAEPQGPGLAGRLLWEGKGDRQL